MLTHLPLCRPAALLVALCAVLMLSAEAHAVRINFTTQPECSEIGPDNTLARYTLSVVDDAGVPVRDVRLKYTLHAPPKNAFFSTDFPIVEGTPLMEADVVVPDGSMSFDYLTPIRGEYRLVVEAHSTAETAAFAPVTDEIRYRIAENADEVRNGFLLFALLFGIGLTSGFVIARPRFARPVLVTASLLLLFSMGSRDAWAHGQKHGATPAGPAGGTTTSDSVALSVDFEPDGGRVGEFVTIRGDVRDAAGQSLPGAKISIRLHHIEDDKTMYEGSFIAPGGRFEWKNQFFDGAEHRVFVTASPLVDGAFTPVTFESVIDVEAIDPPNAIIIRTWIFLVGLTAAGMACGTFLARIGRSPRAA